jgi:hypothetical protein
MFRWFLDAYLRIAMLAHLNRQKAEKKVLLMKSCFCQQSPNLKLTARLGFKLGFRSGFKLNDRNRSA